MRNGFPLDPITVVRITGADRLKWLNNLVTNEMRKTAENLAVECFVTDVKGRTLSHGLVIPESDSLLYFAWSPNRAPSLISHWDRYIIREDVTLADESANRRWGLARRDWLATTLGEPQIAELPEPGVISAEAPVPVLIVAANLIGRDWLLIACASSTADAPSMAEVFADVTAVERMELEAHRIRQRWPLFGVDFDEKNLPQELDRDAAAVSFNKGCYLGQETVARLDALGQVQKKLVRLSIDISDRSNEQPIRVGSRVQAGDNDVGTITSMAGFDESGGFMALAYVRRGSFAPGTHLTCHGFPATVQGST